jgi:hypothetical protein
MRWPWLPALGGAMVLLTACGIGGSAPPPPTSAPAVSPAPSVQPTATRAASPAPATAAPKPTDTPQPASSQTVWVGNTDGEGVYVRNTPAMSDRARAYADGTPLTIIGEDLEGDGQQWKHVRTPDGLEGFVPSMYTVDTPP